MGYSLIDRRRILVGLILSWMGATAFPYTASSHHSFIHSFIHQRVKGDTFARANERLWVVGIMRGSHAQCPGRRREQQPKHGLHTQIHPTTTLLPCLNWRKLPSAFLEHQVISSVIPPFPPLSLLNTRAVPSASYHTELSSAHTVNRNPRVATKHR